MSSLSPPSKSSLRRRKHSSSRTRKNKNASRNNMAVIEPSSPSSPLSWRLEEKTSATKKSHGIPPAQFHAKQERRALNFENEQNAPSSSTSVPPRKPSIPAWKEQIEHNLLIQEQKAFMNELESRRKGFRRITQLKTWPLQDMAMEHLDHLLGANASCQFHGGDYLSAESSSSVSSVESSKPRLAAQSRTTITRKKCTSKPESTATDENKTNIRSTENSNDDSSVEQSAKITVEEANSKTDQIDHIVNHEKRKTSSLWSLEPRIFATEKGNGKRKYLVGQFGRIADWYWRKTEPASRHLYEVIREGSPCRLYFDLEFSRAHNPSVPTVQLLRELEDELATELEIHYGTFLPRLKSSQIINLDSSNEKKFSRHWIVHLLSDGEGEEDPDATIQEKRQEFLFKDAPTVGRFIKRMVGRLADEIGVEGGDFAEKRPALTKYLFVNTKDAGKQTCFIDLGVYTRNRLFRCLESSKKGKATTLQVVLSEGEETNSSKETVEIEGGDEQIDFASTRTFFPLSMPPKKEASSSSQPLNIQSLDEFIVANDWEPHARALADSLVVPLNQKYLSPASIIRDKDDDNDLSNILEIEEGSTGSSSISAFIGSSQTGSRRKYPPTTLMARHGSPLPSLDQYVIDCLGSRGGVRGSIRAWSIEHGPRETPVSFTYHIQKNRFCEIIGRSHKSNGIYWTIDLSSWTCIQGCFDRECYGRGSPIPIPNDGQKDGKEGRLDKIRQEFDAWQEEEFEKALMALNIDDVVASRNNSEAPRSQLDQTRNDPAENEQTLDDLDTLSDDALLQAVLDNPELFP